MIIIAKTIQDQAKNFNITSIMVTAIVTALAFVVGLFWNDAIRTAIEALFPARDEATLKVFAAVIVTIGVSIVIYVLYRTQKMAEKYEKEFKKVIVEQKKMIDIKRKKLKRYLEGSEI